MIKSFFKIFIVLILIILISFIGFYFWGSSAASSESSYATINSSEKAVETPGDTFSIMTYNVGYLSGMNNNQAAAVVVDTFRNHQHQLIETIDELQLDIVAFQEIDFGSARSYDGQQLDTVRMQTNLVHTAMVVNWDKHYVPFPYWPVSSHFGKILSGQALASKYPIVRNDRIVLEKRLDAPFYYNAFYLDRLIQLNKVTIGGRPLITMNVHLEAFDQETRMQQAVTVLEVYNEMASEYPVILLGDFNANADQSDGDETIRMILKGRNIAPVINDSLYRARPRDFYTYSSAEPDRKIDYIFYSKDKLLPLDARVATEFGTVSDHLPVMCRFTWKE